MIMRYRLMRILLIVSLLLPGAAPGEVYRWTDSDGVVQYGDQPTGDAERADLPALQSAEAPPVDTGGDAAAGGSRKPEAPRPTLAAPAPEATIRDGRGIVPTRVSLQSDLAPDRKLVFYLDGEATGSPTRRTQVQLRGVERGEHRVSVAVTQDGREITRTDPVTFYMRRPSALGPNQTDQAQSDDAPQGAPAAPSTGRSGGAPAAPAFNPQTSGND